MNTSELNQEMTFRVTTVVTFAIVVMASSLLESSGIEISVVGGSGVVDCEVDDVVELKIGDAGANGWSMLSEESKNSYKEKPTGGINIIFI